MTNNKNEQEAKKRPLKSKGHRKNNEHNRDINSKRIFRDPVLCAQFFHDNFDIPELKNVKPEDIKDISERYIPYLGTEFDSDSVKKIRILDIGQKEKLSDVNHPPFFVSLIDHKSLVDYDVSMQLLRYMMCIWTEYKREMETRKEGCTRSKAFRYPVIIPIVYYEGKAKWTADRYLSSRIGKGSECREWIPDFKYELIRIHDYSNEELLRRGNEMALVMLMNKVQNGTDLEKFIRIPGETLDQIVRNSPRHVLDVLASVMESLCFKIEATEEERTECVRKVRKREMGYLFENMEHISLKEMRQKIEGERKKLQTERQKTEAERQKAETERQKAETEHQKAEAERQKAEAERKRAADAEEKLRIAEETIKQLLKKTDGNAQAPEKISDC